MPILIRNLPRNLTESELQSLFSPFGEVLSCDLVMDQNSGESKGFGFVELANDDAVQKAIHSLNATEQHGKKIRVKWSNQEKHQLGSHSANSTTSAQFEDKHTSDSSHQNIWNSVRPRQTDSPGEYD